MRFIVLLRVVHQTRPASSSRDISNCFVAHQQSKPQKYCGLALEVKGGMCFLVVLKAS